MSERHMREARELMEAAHEAVSDGCVDAWRACEARAAAALEAAELRGVRAGLAAAALALNARVKVEQDEAAQHEYSRREAHGWAAEVCSEEAWAIEAIDPASVDVKD